MPPQYMSTLRDYSLLTRSYFDKSLRHNNNLEWLFILTFPNGGSTVFAKMLLTAPHAVALNDIAEGQWLVPHLRDDRSRWNPQTKISYRMVKAIWLQRLRALSHTEQTIVIEKSPPHMCRYKSLTEAFSSMKCHLITLARDPYATISSWNQRYGSSGVAREWDGGITNSTGDETGYFKDLARIWLQRARMIAAAQQDSVFDLSYESFVNDPQTAISELQCKIPLLAGINTEAEFKIKDYSAQKLMDMNPKQINLLSEEQIRWISEELATDTATVEKLGYKLR